MVNLIKENNKFKIALQQFKWFRKCVSTNCYGLDSNVHPTGAEMLSQTCCRLLEYQCYEFYLK